MAEARPPLSHLAGLVFDRAASLWYLSLFLEALCLLLGTVGGLVKTETAWGAVISCVALGLLLTAYAMRLAAEDKHDVAQSMRRQAALNDGLGWPVEPALAEEWRRKAGATLLRQAVASPRADGYYTTEADPSPRRLAEMTRESAFYTRHLLHTVRSSAGGLLIGASLALILLAFATLSITVDGTTAAFAAQVIGTAVALVITLDLAGWFLRTGRQTSGVFEVERGLDRFLDSKSTELGPVLRLVSEYDAIVAGSIPIHPWLFGRKHDEINALWAHRS